MRIQCAGCGKVIRQDDEPGNPTYGCCDECNRTSFRSKEAKSEAETIEVPHEWVESAAKDLKSGIDKLLADE